jgi:hypothetical protein
VREGKNKRQGRAEEEGGRGREGGSVANNNKIMGERERTHDQLNWNPVAQRAGDGEGEGEEEWGAKYVMVLQ